LTLAVLQLVNGAWNADGRGRERGEDCIGSDALCSLQAYLHRSRSAFPGSSAFWFSDVFMSLSSLQPIKALSSTLPTSPFWLVQVYPYSFCGLFQRLFWFFFPSLALACQIPATTMGSRVFWL
jgi:hypothetical protein